MNIAPGLAAAAALTLLGACSPAPQQPEVKDQPRPAVAAMTEPAKPTEPEVEPVFDAEGNELDPELADAVRENMAERGSAAEAEEDPDAVPAE